MYACISMYVHMRRDTHTHIGICQHENRAHRLLTRSSFSDLMQVYQIMYTRTNVPCRAQNSYRIMYTYYSHTEFYVIIQNYIYVYVIICA